MHKLNSLRQALIDAVPQLNDHPDYLQMSVGSGNIDARLASSLSFEKKYELKANISSFAGDSEGSSSRYWPGCVITSQIFLPSMTGEKTGFSLVSPSTTMVRRISALACSSPSAFLFRRSRERCMPPIPRSRRYQSPSHVRWSCTSTVNWSASGKRKFTTLMAVQPSA